MTQVVQWFKNGDHPQDNCEELTDDNGTTFLSEGEVVRRYRHPNFPGVQNCAHCGYTLDRHGWLDTGGDGQVVCPGDFILPQDDLAPVAVKPHTLVLLNGRVELRQWNPADEDGRRKFTSTLNADGEGFPGIRHTSYMEVARLLGTSGCSKYRPHWDWSVMGAIDHGRGVELVLPDDWVEVDRVSGRAVRVFR